MTARRAAALLALVALGCGSDEARRSDGGAGVHGGDAAQSPLDAASGIDAVRVDGGAEVDAASERDAAMLRDAGDRDAGDAGGSADAGPTTDAGETPDSGEPDAGGDAGCTASVVAIQHVPAELLIVLDRSGSMSSPIPTFPPNFTPKWDLVRDALNALAPGVDARLRLGLLEFPTNDDCAVDGASALRVPIDLFQSPEIAAYFTTRSPNGNTPSSLALQAARTHYQALAESPAGRAVLFITDGEPTCSAGDVVAETVAAVSGLADDEVPTYVLGFGGSFVDDTVLEQSALAGLVPRPGGPPSYYGALSAAELSSVLGAVFDAAVSSCLYALASAPSDPDAVSVTVNGNSVPRSLAHTDGWDYAGDGTLVRFFGTACDLLASSTPVSVGFAQGCP